MELRPCLQHPESDLLGVIGQWQPEILRCPMHIGNAELLLETVEEAGHRRFQDKVKRLVGDVEALGADEALYRTLAEALGYSANRRPFRKLAEALPFALISSLSPFDAEELLLSAAGLTDRLCTPFIDAPILPRGELVTFRVRPSNSPSTRLRALARLATTYRSGLAQAIAVSDADGLWKLFVVEADSVLVGRGRADDIAINIALPYKSAYQAVDDDEVLRRMRAPGDNRWVNALRAKLVANGLKIPKYRALHQQGLLDLSLRFCRFDHCEACPLHGEHEN